MPRWPYCRKRAESWSDAPVVSRRKLRRDDAERDRTADADRHSRRRLELAHVAALNLRDREDRRAILMGVKILGGFLHDFPSREPIVPIVDGHAALQQNRVGRGIEHARGQHEQSRVHAPREGRGPQAVAADRPVINR